MNGMTSSLLLVLVVLVVLCQGKRYGSIEFIEEPKDIQFISTIQAEIKCRASGTPPPKITWLTGPKDAVLSQIPNILSITKNRLIFHTFHSNQYNSTIHNTTYKCKASNSVGSILSRNVHVRAELDIKYSPVVYHQTSVVGGRAIFKCQIPQTLSSYIQTYSWKVVDKESQTRSIMIGSNFDVYTALQTGELIVSNIQKAFNGYKFSCVSQNTLNNATITSSPGVLYVNDGINFSLESIVEPFHEHKVTVGDSVILNCQASAYPLPKYSWMKDGKQLSINRFKTIIGGSIEIKDFKHSDGGKYTCIINNDLKYSYDTILEVKEMLAFIEKPQSIYESPNNLAMFTCNVTTSRSPVTITWFHNGEEVQTSDRISYTSTRDILTIVNLEASDEGIYQCIAANKFDQIKASAQLVVSSTLPTITKISSSQTVNSGSLVTMNCTFTGSPIPKLTWLFEEFMTLKTSRLVTIKEISYNSTTSISTLTLRNASTNMSGSYKCIAGNRIGQDYSHMDLYVNGVPMIVNFTERVYGHSDESLYLHCHARGHPGITYTWFKHGNMEITSNVNSIVYSNGTLHIKAFNGWQDKGSYTCKATNDYGTDQKIVTVDFVEPPSIGSIDFSPVLASTRQKFLCECTRGSSNGLKITWYKDGVDVSNIPSIDLKVVDSYSTLLSFSSVKAEDRGYYTCVAENNAGRISISGSLVVLEKARFITPPQDSSVLYSHQAMLSCLVSGFPQPQITWFKKNEEGNFHVLQLNHRIKQLHNGTLYFGVTNAFDDGVYHCQASSDNELPTLNSEEVTLNVRVPAKVIGTSEPIAREENGKSLALTCSVAGTPPLTVNWFKKGAILDEVQNKYVMSTVSSTSNSKLFVMNATLLIVDLSRQDNAYYECLGSNTHGSNKATFRLVIEEKPYKPLSVDKTSSASKSITLSWKPNFDGNLPILNYVIQCCEEEQSWEEGYTYQVNGNATSYVVSGLQPGSLYQFRVKALNKIGSSAFSEVKAFATNEEAPSAAPTKIAVKAVRKDQILVTWQPPPKSNRNGVISQYTIFYTSTSTLRPVQTRNVTVSRVTKHMLTGLYQYTGYKIWIQASTKVGHGPSSKPFYATTLEGVPSVPPTAIKIYTLSSKAISVSWNAIPELHRNGALQGYLVKCTSTETGLDRELKVKDKLQITIRNLKTHTKYRICVAGYTNAGTGVFSDCYVKWTYEDVPEKPTYFKAIPANPNEIMLTWRPPVNKNGVLLHYFIYYKREDEKQEVKIRTNPHERQYSVGGLNVTQKYTFRMTAATKKGEGNSTDVVLASTAVHVPASIITPDRFPVLVPVGSDVSLPCTAVGYPKPSISWQSNVNGFNRGKRWMAEDKPKLLYRITKEMEGEYTCTASNQYGKDENVVILTVQVPPSPPQNVIAEISESSTQRTHRSTNNREKNRYTLKIRWTSGDNGNSEIMHHVVYHAVKDRDSNWLISKIPKDQTWFMINNITELSVYFKVASENTVGVGAFTSAFRFDIVPATAYTRAFVHPTVVWKVFDDNANDDGVVKRLLKPILISSVAIITILIVLLLIASWDRNERRITGPKCNRLTCCCFFCCRSRKPFNTDPYAEPHLPWPWNIKRNRYSGAFELEDELIPISPQEHVEIKFHDETALNYNVIDDDIPRDHKDSYNKNFEPVVFYTANHASDNETLASGSNSGGPPIIKGSKHSSIESINRSSGRFQRKYPPSVDPYFSEQSLIEKYLESQGEYDTDSFTNHYTEKYPDIERVSIQDEPVHNSLERKQGDMDSRGSADGKPMDLPDYNELYGTHPERPPPQYGEQEIGYCDYSDAPRALFRGGEGGSVKRKRNRKSLDSLLLKTLEDIEEQAILTNTPGEHTPAIDKHAAVVRESLKDATCSFDSVSSTCSSSVGELRRAFEFGKKYGLQQSVDLPPYLHDSVDDLTIDDLSDDEFMQSAKLLDMIDLTHFSEQPKSVNDIKVKIPLPVRLHGTDEEGESKESSVDLEESEYGRPGMPALSLV